MILLRLISWPYFRKHLLRTVLTTGGIVLGVAVFVGMHTANQRVILGFSETIDRIAGKTELQITAGESGFGEDVLERVQSAASVRVAVPVIESVVDSNVSAQGSLLVLGVDMTGDRSLREYDLDSAEDEILDDPLIFLAQPDSIILTKDFADRNGIAVGDRLSLGTVEGQKDFTVRGIMKPSGLASAYGGNLAIMDVYAAQKMFGRGRTFDRIDLAVTPGSTIDASTRELQSLLGPAFEVQPPTGRGQQFEAMLAGYSTMVGISSAFALFIGSFIIYNSFAIAVAQRRFEIGVLRALGASREQIGSLFLAEGAVLGVLGSAAGLLVGIVIAQGMAQFIAGLITDVYGVAQRVGDVATDPRLLSIAFGTGVLTSVAAAAFPAYNAARLDPVHALKKGTHHVHSAREHRIRGLSAAACGIVAVSCLFFAESRPLFYAGYAAAIIAAVVLAPVLSLALAKALRPMLRWCRPVEGTLAADSLIQSPRRTAGSVTALMLAIAIVVAFSGMARANYFSIIDWSNAALNPDLFVVPSQSLENRSSRFPATMANEIAGIQGVSRVQTLRNNRVTFRGASAMLIATEIRSVAETVERRNVAGDTDEMYRKAAGGEGVIVSDNLAELENLGMGDMVELAAPYGLIRLPIVGVIVDYSDQRGTILVDRSVFLNYWRDDSVHMFRVYVREDAAVAEVRSRVLEHYQGHRQVFVLTNSDLRNHIERIVGQWFGLTSIQIAVAVFVAILGIVNTLTVSITDRRRELGVLQAVGGSRAQVRRTIWIEALSIGAIGLILGIVLGAGNLHYILEIVRRDIAGVRLEYMFPAATVLMLVPIILGTAFVASLWPAESAVRGSLVEALEYE